MAAPGNGLDEARGCRGVAKRVANPIDCDVDAVLEVDERAVGPERGPHLLSGHQFPGAREEQTEGHRRLLRQPHLASVLAERARRRVELEDTPSDDARGVGGHER